MESVNIKVSHLIKLFRSSPNVECDKSPSTLAIDEQNQLQVEKIVKDGELIQPRTGD